MTYVSATLSSLQPFVIIESGVLKTTYPQIDDITQPPQLKKVKKNFGTLHEFACHPCACTSLVVRGTIWNIWKILLTFKLKYRYRKPPRHPRDFMCEI